MPVHALSIGVEIGVNISNTTTVTVAPSASIEVGTGEISSVLPVSAFIAATDTTNVTTSLTLDDPVNIPVASGVFVFSAIDSDDSISRTTVVDVGNDSATTAPASNFADTLSGGEFDLSATSGGAISNDETSTGLGTVEITTPAAGDVTSVEVAGVNVGATGLALLATSNTAYEDQGHLSSITVLGDVAATLSDSNVTAGDDGLTLDAEDNSSASATSVQPNFDPTTGTVDGKPASGVTIAFNRTTSIITYDKDVAAEILDSSVTSDGVVRVQAVDNQTISSDDLMVSDGETTGKVSVAGGGMLAANLVNGSAAATVQDSKIVTTGGASDLQVLAGDSSTITSYAETSSVSSSTSTSVSVSGTVALNAIGWTIDTSAAGLAAASLGTILGSDTTFWQNNAPTDPTHPGAGSSNVTASIVDSTLAIAGALAVQAVAAGAVNATVTNVSSATSTANGDGLAVATGGIVGSNRVSRAASAFLDSVTPASGQSLAGGAVSVIAANTASITSNSTLITSAIASSADAKTDFVATDDPGNASSHDDNLKTTTNVNFGQTVLFKAKYSTDNLFGTSVPQNVDIEKGDTVFVAPDFTGQGTTDQVYQYVGADQKDFDLESQDYTDTSLWTPISGVEGKVYKFMGADGTAVDLADGDLFDSSTGTAVTTITPNYYDLGYWMPVPKAELKPATNDHGAAVSGSASGVAVGGIVVLNVIDGGAYAIVQNGTNITGASLDVAATDSETITATIDATANASGGSSFSGADGSSGVSLAVNGSIAINEILGDADAHVIDSSVTTSAGDVDVTATGSSDIEASTSSAVTASSGGGQTVAVGVVMADNTIGSAFQNLLDLTVDTLAGGTVVGHAAPSATTAYILNSSIDAQGALSVAATSDETINAKVTNAATAAVEPSDGGGSYSASAVLTDNQIQSSTVSYIDNRGANAATVSAGGALSVTALDKATISATSAMTALGTQAAAGPANEYADLATAAYDYTDKSGVKTVKFGDKVAVQQSDGTIIVYQYMGSPSGTSLDLSKPVAAGGTAEDYTDLEYWKPLSADQIKEEDEAASAHPTTGDAPGEKVSKDSSDTTFGSASLYVLFDYNNVVGSTSAYITDSASVGGASVAVTASETGSITADDSSVVTTGSGGFGAGGVVATNHVIGGASAYIDASTVTANAGSVAVAADDTASITATETTALTADGDAVSIEAAFNVIGWQDDNFGLLALGTLLGDDSLLGSATPDLTQAYIGGDSQVTASDDVTVNALGSASITATVGDQASAGNPDATATLNVGGVLATNKINSSTAAYIGTSPLVGGLAAASPLDSSTGLPAATTTLPTLDASSVTATTGNIQVNANDDDKLEASSTITLSATASSSPASSKLSDDYRYTDQSGQETVKVDDKVYFDGNIYAYKGDGSTPADGVSIDLGDATQKYATSADWTKLAAAATPQDNTASESKAIGAVFVLNDVRGGAYATIGLAGAAADDLTAGNGVSVQAIESASIDAHTISNLTSTGGAAGSGSNTEASTGSAGASSKGGGLALGGAIDTNLVLGQALATIQGATISAGAGGVAVDADDKAQLNAETLVASSTGGGASQTSVDLSIAFNSIGYAPENFLFNSVDALVGGDYLSNPNPDNATAFILDAAVKQDGGDLSVTAESNEQVNATVSNAASSTTSDLSDASSSGFGGVLSSNKVAGSAVAYIDESALTQTFTASGNVKVAATDAAGIYSNVKLVAASVVSTDGGTGSLDDTVAKLNGSPGASYTATATSGSAHDDETLVFGDTVLLGAGYDTPDYTVGAKGLGNKTVGAGDVVADGDDLYRYVGAAPQAFNLADDSFIAANSADFVKIAGQEGQTYEYMGPPADATASPAFTGTAVDLFNTDYTDLAYWKLVPITNAIPAGLNVPAPSTNDSNKSTDANDAGAAKEGASSNEAGSTSKPSGATSVGGILVLNDVVSATQAFIRNAKLSAADINVQADDKANITAINDSTVIAQTSELGSSKDLAVNGVIATNLVQDAANALVTQSHLTAGGADDDAVAITASNTASIDAINQAQTSSGTTAVGLVLAFNSIGYQASNFLFNAVDALLGNSSDIQDAIGVSPLSNVTAESYESQISATQGGVSIAASLKATIDATTSNATSSLGAALENASAVAVGAILATNQINANRQRLRQSRFGHGRRLVRRIRGRDDRRDRRQDDQRHQRRRRRLDFGRHLDDQTDQQHARQLRRADQAGLPVHDGIGHARRDAGNDRLRCRQRYVLYLPRHAER